jgi:hypothetical protein
MPLPFGELLARNVVNDRAALAALATPITADSVPYFWHTQESFPYFTNRIGPWSIENTPEDSEDIDVITVDVLKRLVIGHITSGYKGENDTNFAAWLAQLLEYYNEREWLQSATYPDEMRYLTRARLVSGPGYTIFVNSAVGGVVQIGGEATLRCEFEYDILQAY